MFKNNNLMQILNHRYLKNFWHYFLRILFNIPGMIALISVSRFIYFVYIKKNFKTLYSKESKPEAMGFNADNNTTALYKNTKYLRIRFNNLIGILSQFHSIRSMIPIWPLKSFDFIRPINMRVLSIGPRTEAELFRLVSMGFQLKNIESIDIQSYSNLIQLGDAINIPFEDNSFDLVIIGWVLVYTNEPNKAVKEVIRILKNNGIVSMCHSHNPIKEAYSNFHIKSSKIMLDLFGENLGYVYLKYHPFDEKVVKKQSRSNFILSIKK